MWDLGQRIKPVSSALTGRFTTTGPRGKSYVIFHTDIGSLTDSYPWPGLPWCFSGKKSVCQDRRHGFYPWVRKIPLSRKWQPAPVFLPGKFHGQTNLVGYSPWGCKESDTTEHAQIHTPIYRIIPPKSIYILKF